MIGFGAIIKSIARSLEIAASAAVLGLRLALGGRRPKLCPVHGHVEVTGRRR